MIQSVIQSAIYSPSKTRKAKNVDSSDRSDRYDRYSGIVTVAGRPATRSIYDLFMIVPSHIGLVAVVATATGDETATAETAETAKGLRLFPGENVQ